MARRKRCLPSSGTLPERLLTLTALSGELPAIQVGRLSTSESYRTYAVKQLKKEKLLRTYYHAGLRGLRLTSAAKKYLISDQPDRYLPLFSGETATNAPKYSVPHRLRLHRMAEVLVTMYQAGVSTLPWEKPAIFQPVPPPRDLMIDTPAYYSSREIKELGELAVKIRGSRATGVLLVDGGIFVVYNTGAAPMKWEYKSEMRLKALLQTELCMCRLPLQFIDAAVDAIVLGSTMDGMEYLMGPGDTKARNYLVHNGDFPHVYYLTNDHRGEVLLQLLCDPGLKTTLDDILLENLFESRPGGPVENDALDEGGMPVLLGYTCDMPRIRRFDTALKLHEQTGVLFCFDFQEEVLRRVCGPQVTFQSINFDAYERSVLHISQATD